MFSSASDALVATTAFFDRFGIALSTAELWTYCARHDNARQERSAVDELLMHDARVARTDGLWTLHGRTALVRERLFSGAEVHKKWRVLWRAARIARLVPFLQLFAACNTLGYGVARADGDIDVFVIASRARLWTVRFFLTMLLHVARLRRHDKYVRDRMCLSFFVATDALGVASLSLVPEPFDSAQGKLRRRATIDAPDPYLAFWVGSVVPLIDRGAYADFITANRPFVEHYQHHLQPRERPPTVIPSQTEGSRTSPFTRLFEIFFRGFLGNALESVLRFIQVKKIIRSSAGKTRENATAVVISNHVLKFHEEDRRREIREAWLKRFEELGIMADSQFVIPSQARLAEAPTKRAEGSRMK